MLTEARSAAQRVIALRGATTAEVNTRENILGATRELLQNLAAENGFVTEDVISVLFTLTPDLDAVFPAEAARQLGWTSVPLMCAQELPVPDALPRCIRVLLHLYAPAESAPHHSYLRGAAALRPDLAGQESNSTQRKEGLQW